jgi:hypothetical protein
MEQAVKRKETARLGQIWPGHSCTCHLTALETLLLIVYQDMDQVEEWNEFGELEEQIESADDFLDGAEAPPNPNAISLRPEPGPGVANSLTPIQPASGTRPDHKSAASSRASSETRHISISEPTSKESGAKSPQPTSNENPMTMTMRQLGAEAAAKAKEVKRKVSSTPSKTETASAPAEVAAEPSAPAISAKEREASDPSIEPEVTAGKTPSALAAEGAKRTSVDKIESQVATSTSSPTSESVKAETSADEGAEPESNATVTQAKSTEEQVLELRRQSTQISQPSKLHESISADADDAEDDSAMAEAKDTAQYVNAIEEDVEPPVAEAVSDKAAPKSEAATPTEVKNDGEVVTDTEPESKYSDSVGSKAAVPELTTVEESATPPPPSSHRGSSVEIADKDQVKAIEEATKINEHPEESRDDDELAVAESTAAPGSEKTTDKPAATAVLPLTSESEDHAKDETAAGAKELESKPLPESADLKKPEPLTAEPSAASQTVEDASPTTDTIEKVEGAEHDDTAEEKPQDTAAKDPDAASKSVED